MRPVQLEVPNGALVVRQGQSVKKLEVSVVIPTYSENQNIFPLVTQITEQLNAEYSDRYEIIVVDDNSPDGTADAVLQLAQKFPQLHLMKRVDERGLATAVVRGWQQACGEILAVMDADLQHPAHVLVKLINAVKNGADVAIASRYINEGSIGSWNLPRRTMSKCATHLSGLLLPEVIGRVNDPMSGYFALRRGIIEGLLLKPRGYKILLETLARGRVTKVVEIPFQFGIREHGETKVTWRQYVEYLQQLWELRIDLWKNQRPSQ